MSETLCRLCFLEKPRRVSIFGGKGTQQKIAEVIRTHFSDEITENDHLPQSVCLVCWIKVDNFHKFYVAVNEARKHFLLNFVKNEEANSIDIDHGSVECSDDFYSAKFEPNSDIDVAENGTQSFENIRVDENFATEVLESNFGINTVDDTSVALDEPNGHVDDEDSEPYCGVTDFSNDDENDGNHGASDEYIVKFEKGHSPKVETVAIDKVEIATEFTANVDVTTDVLVNPDNEVNAKSDYLISIYMEMHCEICRHPFQTLSEARRHYWRKHQRRTATLKCCQRRIRISDIRDHIHHHLNPNIFKCAKCGRTYTTRRKLRAHKNTHLPKRFECDICHEKFRTKYYIRMHIQDKHVSMSRQIECNICKKLFLTTQKLQQHSKIIHERYYEKVCHVCAKVCNSSSSLTQHLLEHSDTKQPRAICQICGRSFKDKRGLSKHMNNHRDEGHSFTCPQCPKISPNRQALRRHISSMHEYTIYKCSMCSKEFKRAEALKEHVATHTGENLYKCVYCPKMCRSNSNMCKHYKQCHLAQWKADKLSKC